MFWSYMILVYSSLLPGLKLEWPVYTTALPVLGHEWVKAQNFHFYVVNFSITEHVDDYRIWWLFNSGFSYRVLHIISIFIYLTVTFNVHNKEKIENWSLFHSFAMLHFSTTLPLIDITILYLIYIIIIVFITSLEIPLLKFKYIETVLFIICLPYLTVSVDFITKMPVFCLMYKHGMLK